MRRKRDCGFGYRFVPCQPDPDDRKNWTVAGPVRALVCDGDWINVELPNESHLGEVVSVTVHYEMMGETKG